MAKKDSMENKIVDTKEKLREQFDGLLKQENELLSKLGEVRELKARCLGAAEVLDGLNPPEENGSNDTEQDK